MFFHMKKVAPYNELTKWHKIFHWAINGEKIMQNIHSVYEFLQWVCWLWGVCFYICRQESFSFIANLYSLNVKMLHLNSWKQFVSMQEIVDKIAKYIGQLTHVRITVFAPLITGECIPQTSVSVTQNKCANRAGHRPQIDLFVRKSLNQQN